MGGAQPAHTTQTTEVKLPAWVDAASQSNYQMAQQVANLPLQQWGGADVAKQSGMTTQGYGMLRANAGAQDPNYAKAQGLYDKSVAPFDPTPYLNPYTGEVESRAIDNANRALTGQLQASGDAARKAGAFGGTAEGAKEAVMSAEGARGIGDLSAQLRSAGYDKATADMFADRAGMQSAASGIANTATAAGSADVRDASALLGAGQQRQAYNQSALDAQKARFQEKVNYPLERLNILMSSLGMSPYGKTEKVDKTSTSEKQGPDFATIGLGLLQMLPMMFSDKRMKKNIQKLGTDKNTKLPMYAYRYKGDPANSPKVVGPMAQDVQKKYPDMVGEAGGMKTVHPGILAATGAFGGTELGNEKVTNAGVVGESSLSPAYMTKRRPVAGSKFELPVFS